jgi:elongation factor P hydroxylase
MFKIQPDPARLVQIFDRLFLAPEQTQLKMGADEPFYKAPVDNRPGVIYAREDYFSSALHEIAHWSIAGVERRKLDDFGYWYEPEGRTEQQQELFEQVEVKPQAIEWLLSLACSHHFNFSADNISAGIDASESFKQAVTKQAESYLRQGLPARAQRFFDELNCYFRDGAPVSLCSS